jgi:ribosomal protein L24E
MGDKCKTCKKEFNKGIWLSPQFKDEKVLLFCSEKCKKKYLKRKLQKIKIEYPSYYNKLISSKPKNKFFEDVLE